MADYSARLTEINAMPPDARIEALVRLGGELRDAGPSDAVAPVVQALVQLLDEGAGDARARLQLGEVLGYLGDPRLRGPSDADYWVEVPLDEAGSLEVGRFHVTNAEFRAWAEAGGYDDDACWSEEGLAWRDATAHRWLDLARDPKVAHLVVPNQPVAGPTWWEAEAYARAHGARLLTMAEHRWIMRGVEKRPYPWGAPFGDGNANTREEALGRPCAVGLFLADRTPEGVCDLAGNMGEWLSDEAGDQRVIHPGSWARPSMAAWAKALEMAEPDARSADLSFRLAR